ncbi:Uncharacterised protein [Yersinia mollaretii]|uniref:Uncharacterized protein n=1 Tax=Yersinia mollaretii TaxID=33060 RepID=A0AA36PJI2_YERMO|nr:Uncharacterised protein [Yersinia mollaretii]
MDNIIHVSTVTLGFGINIDGYNWLKEKHH